MNDLRSHDPYHDDIDLLAFLARSIAFFKKYRWLFLIAITLGLVLGFFRYKTLPVVYKSRLVLQSTILTNQNNIQIVANWNRLLRSHEYKELATQFNMREDAIKKLKELKAEEIQKIFTPTNPNGFTIDVKVTDPQLWDSLQTGIVYGFNNNGFIKDRLAIRKERLLELISKTGDEIKRLDSVKNTVQHILDGKRPGGSLVIDAPGISRQLIEMNEKYLSYKEDLHYSTSVQVIQGFGKFQRPAGNNLLVWLILGVVPGLAIAYVLALFHSLNRKLKQHQLLHKPHRPEDQ